jgi:hypothetical protein
MGAILVFGGENGRSEREERKKGFGCAKKRLPSKFDPTEGNVFWARAHATPLASPFKVIGA